MSLGRDRTNLIMRTPGEKEFGSGQVQVVHDAIVELATSSFNAVQLKQCILY